MPRVASEVSGINELCSLAKKDLGFLVQEALPLLDRHKNCLQGLFLFCFLSSALVLGMHILSLSFSGHVLFCVSLKF